MAMPKNVLVLAGVAALLGLLAVVLGFLGESATSSMMSSTLMRMQYSLDRFNGTACVYRRTPAAGYGVVAALLLLTAQIIVTVAAGCSGQHQTPSSSRMKRAAAVSMSVVSWYVRACTDELSSCLTPTAHRPIVAAAARCRLLVVIAVGIFVYGASWNAGAERSPAAKPTSEGPVARCYELRRGVFATASVLSLVAVGLGVASYALLRAESTTTAALGLPEAAMDRTYEVSDAKWIGAGDGLQLGWAEYVGGGMLVAGDLSSTLVSYQIRWRNEDGEDSTAVSILLPLLQKPS
ncbi:hypothetical protein ACP4OV_003060 [Aristida adscensionis]